MNHRHVTSCPFCGEPVAMVVSISQGGAHLSASHAPPVQGCPIIERARLILQTHAGVFVPPDEAPIEKAN